jgi:predicted PurR-regulated permease PerM
MAPSNTPRVLSQLLAVILAAVVIGTLYLAKTVIFPLALALLITFMFAPLVGWLERIRVPRILAVLSTIFAAALVLGTVAWIVGTQLIGVADDFPTYTLNVQNKIDAFRSSKTTRFTRAQEEVNRLSQQIESLNADIMKSRGTLPKKSWEPLPKNLFRCTRCREMPAVSIS